MCFLLLERVWRNLQIFISSLKHLVWITTNEKANSKFIGILQVFYSRLSVIHPGYVFSVIVFVFFFYYAVFEIKLAWGHTFCGIKKASRSSSLLYFPAIPRPVTVFQNSLKGCPASKSVWNLMLGSVIFTVVSYSQFYLLPIVSNNVVPNVSVS